MNNWLYKLERRYGRLGISNLMTYIVATQLVVFLIDLLPGLPDMTTLLMLHWGSVLNGQVWRLVTFIFLPTTSNPLLLVISLMFYYFIGQSLEHAWGKFSFTLYYVCGIACTILSVFLMSLWLGPFLSMATNYYLNLSLFLAFACIAPDEQFRLYFLIPIKAKHLAIISGALVLLDMIRGTWMTRISILAALLNFLIFFGPDLIRRIRNTGRYSSSRRNFKRNKSDYEDFWR